MTLYAKAKARRGVISINGRFLGRNMSGVERFALEVLRVIDRMYSVEDEAVSDLNFQVVVPSRWRLATPFKNIPLLNVGRLAGQAWEQVDLPLASGLGLLVNLCNTAPIFCRRQLAVIHDAATMRVPESYGWLFRMWYGVMIPIVYRRSASICTVSEFSRKELGELFGARGDVCVLQEGTEHMARVIPDTAVLDRHCLRQRPFVLVVSSLSPHKNFATVVRAAEMLADSGFDVAIAGGQNPKVFAKGRDDLPASVKYVGYVSDEELKALYENAACFVFPSLYEGYGLPPTEAMACGCPVIASRLASIPEVCGDAVEYFDPLAPAELATVLQRVMADESLRDKMRARGLQRASAMQWRNGALALIHEIRRVM